MISVLLILSLISTANISVTLELYKRVFISLAIRFEMFHERGIVRESQRSRAGTRGYQDVKSELKILVAFMFVRLNNKQKINFIT